MENLGQECAIAVLLYNIWLVIWENMVEPFHEKDVNFTALAKEELKDGTEIENLKIGFHDAIRNVDSIFWE